MRPQPLGVGAIGAAIALKEYLQKNNLSGTVRYYGCPAEETLCGKVFMAKAGVLDDLEVAITGTAVTSTLCRWGLQTELTQPSSPS